MGLGAGGASTSDTAEYAHWAVLLLVAASEVENEHAKENRADGESNHECFATALGRQN